MTVNLDESAIRKDVQHVALLQEVADAIVDQANNNTSVNIKVRRSEVEEDSEGPFVIIGAKAAAAVSVEFGTRFRRASSPIRRAAESLGIPVPN